MGGQRRSFATGRLIRLNLSSPQVRSPRRSCPWSANRAACRRAVTPNPAPRSSTPRASAAPTPSAATHGVTPHRPRKHGPCRCDQQPYTGRQTFSRRESDRSGRASRSSVEQSGDHQPVASVAGEEPDVARPLLWRFVSNLESPTPRLDAGQACELQPRLVRDVRPRRGRPVQTRVVLLPLVPPEGAPRHRCSKLVGRDTPPRTSALCPIFEPPADLYIGRLVRVGRQDRTPDPRPRSRPRAPRYLGHRASMAASEEQSRQTRRAGAEPVSNPCHW